MVNRHRVELLDRNQFLTLWRQFIVCTRSIVRIGSRIIKDEAIAAILTNVVYLCAAYCFWGSAVT